MATELIVVLLLLLSVTGCRKEKMPVSSTIKTSGSATIRVCTKPGIKGSPCTPLAMLYADDKHTIPMANPFLSDSMGNYQFYVAPTGDYYIQISDAVSYKTKIDHVYDGVVFTEVQDGN